MNAPKAVEVSEKGGGGVWDVVSGISKALFDTGPSGLAIVVLMIICAGLAYIILQQTKTILSIREMTTETDRQVATSLMSIGSQLSTIQFMLTHAGSSKGGDNVS